LWYVKLPVGFKRLTETPPYRLVKNKQEARTLVHLQLDVQNSCLFTYNTFMYYMYYIIHLCIICK